MSRRKKEQNQKIKFIKLGGGSFRARIGGRERMIKPNETFWAYWEEIPEGHRDVIKPVDPEVKQPEKTENEAQNFEVNEADYYKHHLGGGWYNVFSSEGNQMNETALKSEAADELIKDLSS